MFVGKIGKGDFLPAAAGRKARIVEIPGLSGLRQPDQRHGPGASRRPAIARRQGDKILQAGAGRGQHLGQAFGGRPAQLSIGGAPLALVKGGGVQSGQFRQSGRRGAVSDREGVQGTPDLEMCDHCDL